MTLSYLGSPDLGALFAGYIGSFLLAGSYLAISCLTSAFTRNQVISFIISVVACLFLILAGWPPVTNMLTQVLPGTGGLVDLVSYFSVMTHFESFQRGVVDSRNVLFFLSVIVFSLFSTGVVLRSLRSN
jgi:ABC-2 type transport system permease protein